MVVPWSWRAYVCATETPLPRRPDSPPGDDPPPGRKNRAALPSTLFRPTEAAVGGAVEDLFAALPTPYRASLSEIPDVVARLTARAGSLRAHIDKLIKLGSNSGVTGELALGEVFSRARKELGDTVAAVERIRMDLLRLHGDLVDARPITGALDAVSQFGAQISRLRLAQKEIESLSFIAIDARIPTPV